MTHEEARPYLTPRNSSHSSSTPSTSSAAIAKTKPGHHLATITRAEHAAAARGATVSVVSQDPADETLATLLTRPGYRRTADYFTTPR